MRWTDACCGRVSGALLCCLWCCTAGLEGCVYVCGIGVCVCECMCEYVWLCDCDSLDTWQCGKHPLCGQGGRVQHWRRRRATLCRGSADAAVASGQRQLWWGADDLRVVHHDGLQWDRASSMRSASPSIHDMDVSSTHSRTVIKVGSTDVQQHAAVRMLQVAHGALQPRLQHAAQ